MKGLESGHKKERSIEDKSNLVSPEEMREHGINPEDPSNFVDSLEQFMKDRGEARAIHERKEYLDGQVSHICEKYNVIFVHGVHDGSLDVSTSVKKDTDVATQLKIVLSLSPTVAASTIREGDSKRNMWGHVGVLLNSGLVLHAEPDDAGTGPNGVDGRIYRKERGGPIAEQVERAILKREVNNYNELAVTQPGVAGCYICTDKIGTDEKKMQKITNQLASLGVPLYELSYGQIYALSVIDGKTTRGVRKSTKDILHSSFSVDRAMKEKFLEDILEAAPFNYRSLDQKCIDSSVSGREFYYEMRGWVNDIDDVEWSKKIYNTRGIYYIQNIPGRGLYMNRSFKYSHNSSDDGAGTRYQKQNGNANPIEGIHVASGSYRMPFSISGVADYLRGMKVAIDTERNKPNSEWIVKQLVSHLYGYSQEAGERGDMTLMREGISIAGEYMQLSEYEEIFTSRKREGEGYRMKKEDLPASKQV